MTKLQKRCGNRMQKRGIYCKAASTTYAKVPSPLLLLQFYDCIKPQQLFERTCLFLAPSTNAMWLCLLAL